ncbi:unnamed protein product [Cylicocyclus nassatus]|uniref:Uncharacterized protein n=1 Tax=Cylicocyclus nassatus TaxID=53992 RepID=A0AA36MCJ1_CYLNA|nr:unnamed protein product [Cylicocyclus nassatus]
MILNAIICTTVICRRVFGRRRFSRSMRRREQTQIASRIGAVFLMQLSMGTPWALQYLTLYTPHTTAWHYIFTIVMGSQGTMLALQYLYKRQKSLYFYRDPHNVSHRTKEESLSE